MNEIIRSLHARKSVRVYLDKPISEKDKEAILLPWPRPLLMELFYKDIPGPSCLFHRNLPLFAPPQPAGDPRRNARRQQARQQSQSGPAAAGDAARRGLLQPLCQRPLFPDRNCG